MTWSRFDDAALTHPKARKAGNEAWSLWVGAVMYCNRYLTDGYITLEALASECMPLPLGKAKAKKLADKLVNARLRPDGAGLLESLDDGAYMVHDFLSWSPSKADVEAKRKRDRDRKRLRAEGDTESGNFPRGIPAESACLTRTPAPAPAGTPAPAPAAVSDPIHSDPSPPVRGARALDPPLLAASRRPEYRNFEQSFAGRMPAGADWVDGTSREFAATNALSLDSELEDLRDYAKAKAILSADWNAELRRSMRRHVKSPGAPRATDSDVRDVNDLTGVIRLPKHQRAT